MTRVIAVSIIIVLVAAGYAFGRMTAPRQDSVSAMVMATPTPTMQKSDSLSATVAPTMAPQATPTMVVQVINHGTAQRVQFARGTYGQVLAATDRQTYVLWAAQGQTMTFVSDVPVVVLATDPNGAQLALEGGAAKLPSNGDYLVTIAAAGAFSVAVDIR